MIKMRRETLYAFFESTASPEQEEQVRVWMEESPDNERTFFTELKLYDTATLLAHPIRRATKKVRQLRRVFIEVAAAVILVSGIGCLLYSKHASAVDPVAMQTISVPAGGRVNVTLPDGTNVWLNSLSSLTYPSSFGKDERRVFLDGSAYMEVRKNTGKKFIVATDKGGIEVLGTSFVVDAYSGSNIFETSLIEGCLNVWGEADPSRIVELTPDMKATFADGELIVQSTTDSGRFDWKKGLVIFENMAFTQIMELFEKYYGVTISIQNDNIRNYTCTGKFRQADGVDYALRIMQKDIRFEYSRDNEESVIRIE